MKRISVLCILPFLLVCNGHSQGGLDEAVSIGPFLNGVLPSEKPRPAAGGWQLVDAFPNLSLAQPTQMIPVPFSDQLMVVEKAGVLALIDDEAAWKIPVLDLRDQVEYSDDSGMLGLAFHPEFGIDGSPNRHYLYVFYRYTPDQSETNLAYCRLSRFTWDPDTSGISRDSEFVLIQQFDRHNYHNGGGIFFGADGFLYLSIGDEGGAEDEYDSAQKIDGGLLSGVLRIDVDQDPLRSHPIRRQPADPAPPPVGWPSSFSQGYYIPDDNPWQSPDGDHLEEFFAIGLRSPHRMTIDRPTGQIWVGDVGQASREELSIVTSGANLQWPFQEGDIPGARARPSTLIGFEQPPVHAYDREFGGCVIGGYVYRGNLHPELQGKYIFGDLVSGRIWSLEQTATGAMVEELDSVSLPGMTSFGVDAAGELYVFGLSNTIYRLDKSTSGVPEPPQLLSNTTAFTDLATLAPSPGLIPYDVIQPLWSDGAEKQRWIAIPNDGNPDSPEEQIGWSEEGNWSFPIGTVVIKHFEIPGRRLETRFLVKGEDTEWYGFTYRWFEDGTDAELLPGDPVDESFIINGEDWNWHFPGRNECANCHTDAAGKILGLKTRHLNRDIFYGDTGRTANQIVTLNQLGFFTPAVDESILENVLTSKSIGDTSATLERRARSYLDVNCSHCHQPNTGTQAQFDARLSVPPWYQKLINTDPTHDIGIDGGKIVKPSDIALSVLHHRVGSLAEGVAMPPLAKNVVHTEAVALLRDWINSLDPATSPTGPLPGPVPSDHLPPVISLSMGGGESIVEGTFDVLITASEPIVGLTTDDFDVTNGVAVSLTGSEENWTLQVVPGQNGIGSLSIGSDRVTDLNGNANEALASPLLFDYRYNGSPGNFLTNGSFERDLDDWYAGGSVALTLTAYTGDQAAQIGGDSFIFQSMPVTELTDYRFTGRYTSGGSSTPIEIGVTFWDAHGVWIHDETIPIEPGQNFEVFDIEFTTPLGARTATVWVLTGDGAMVIVDDLEFAEGGNGGPPPASHGGDNLLFNGDFEEGLFWWDSGSSTVEISTNASSGVQSAELGGDSFVVQLLDADPGDQFALSGSYLASDSSLAREVGFTFFKANGEWITDRVLDLNATGTYEEFLIATTAPPETATLMIWTWNDEGGGTLTVDNFVLTKEDASGGEIDGFGSWGGGDGGSSSGGGSDSTGESLAQSSLGNPVKLYSRLPDNAEDLFPVDSWPPIPTGYYQPDGWTYIDYPYVFDASEEKWYRIESDNPLQYLIVGTPDFGEVSDFSGWHWFNWPFSTNEDQSEEYFHFEGENEFAIDLDTGEINHVGSPGSEDIDEVGEIFAVHGEIDSRLESGPLFLPQTWTEDGEERSEVREAIVEVPAGVAGRLPVVILLHGSDMEPEEMLNTYGFLDRMILVSCRGVDGDWNVADFGPKSPDVDFLRTLIEQLKTHQNVDPDQISLLGFSAGAGLVNRMLIECEGDLFANAIMLSQQLRHKQYHSGQFWYDPNGQWGYHTPRVPAQGRRILTIHGHADEVLPYAGRPGDPVWDLWLEAQGSAYAWAVAMGYQGPQLTYEEVIDDFEHPALPYRYLDGQVTHYLIVDGDHRLNVPGQGMAKTVEIIRDFLGQ